MANKGKRRADELLFEQYGLSDLNLARALIMEGRVMMGDRKILAVSEPLSRESVLRVRGDILPWVSRGAHKLLYAIQSFDIDLKNLCCIDIGASTGGFTQVMLRAGAQKVYSVDVGYNQLDYSLRTHPKVVCMERTNARFLTRDQFDPAPTFGATDVSFISLRAILPVAFDLIGEDGRFVALLKPQFEAKVEEVESGGIVRDRNVHRRLLEETAAFVEAQNWRVVSMEPSPIQGAKGNIEFLLDIVHSTNAASFHRDISIESTICKAYDKFMNSCK